MCSVVQIMHLGLIHLSFIFFNFIFIYVLLVKGKAVVTYGLHSFFKLGEGVFCLVGVCLRLNDFLKVPHLFWVMNLQENMFCIMLICVTAFNFF